MGLMDWVAKAAEVATAVSDAQLGAREQTIRRNAVREGVNVDGALLVTSSTSNPQAKAASQRLIFWVIHPDRLEIHDRGGRGLLSSMMKGTETVRWSEVTRLSVTGSSWKTLRVHTAKRPFLPHELFQFPQEVARVRTLIEKLRTGG